MRSPIVTDSHRRKYGMKHRMGTMGILLRGDGSDEVLLIRRRLKTPAIRENGPPDTWSFPGGGVDEDETPEQTIVREFHEEVGLQVSIRRVAIIGDGDEDVWGHTDDYLDEPWRCFLFIVQRCDPSQEPRVMEPHKHVALDWMKWGELWERIETGIAAKARTDDPDVSEGMEGMRFFQTMENMVINYPKRSNAVYLGLPRPWVWRLLALLSPKGWLSHWST